MKKIIRLTESDLTRIVKRVISEQVPNLLKIDFEMFDNDWGGLQEYLDENGNPPYGITGDLDLSYQDVKDLGSLLMIKGDLDLSNSSIESLGDLRFVMGDVNLSSTNLTSFNMLDFIDGDLYIYGSPLMKMSDKQIKNIIDIQGDIIK
jgi:hypothetical protein